jgi:hypothetical protein
MIGPRHAHVWDATHERQVLHMLGQRKRASLKHQNAPAARRVRNEEMLCDYGSECPAADNDDIEAARSSRDALARAVERFLQRVAQEASHVVERKRCGFRRQQLRHGVDPPYSTNTPPEIFAMTAWVKPNFIEC